MTAHIVTIGGELYGVIGTSASAPALTIQRYGHRLGNEKYYIYPLTVAVPVVGIPQTPSNP